MTSTIIINFRGGIISPGDLHNILVAAAKAKIKTVRFGLRQQLLIDVEQYNVHLLTAELYKLQIVFSMDDGNFPNIISSYPAEGVFIRNTWLSEGVYKDILDEMDFNPSVKINICNSNQSFTPMLTGNINWIASPAAEHYWHLIIRFPKTNVIYEWDKLCYTNCIAGLTKSIEQVFKDNPAKFIDNNEAKGDEVFILIDTENLITKAAASPVVLPQFNLPYYEGLNRYDNKYWLGIYRRDELFSVPFLKKLCQLCLDTKLGQLCCTSWKSIIVKGIEEKDKIAWNLLLEEFQINMRHAATELNFQVEDNCAEGLSLKKYLIKYFNIDDTRTFGICIGIKTRTKSEIFSSILIRRRFLIDLPGFKLFRVYDLLYAKDFNPNERTGEIFSKGNPKIFLQEQLRRSILAYYKHRLILNKSNAVKNTPKKEAIAKKDLLYYYQCTRCFTVYDEMAGETVNHIPAGTRFENLPFAYSCQICETGKKDFKKIEQSTLNLQPV
jgi:rubredoxin